MSTQSTASNTDLMTSPTTTTAGALTSVNGSCHCGAVRFRAEIDRAMGSTRCNCRHCTKTGWWSFRALPVHFELLSRDEALTAAKVMPEGAEYWGDRRSCLTCGVNSFSPVFLAPMGGAFVMLNVRCLDDLELDGLTVRHLDGRNDTWAELAVEVWRDPIEAWRTPVAADCRSLDTETITSSEAG